MTRVLIVGGAGFLGASLARRLLRSGDSVIIADSFDDSGDGREVREERGAALQGEANAILVRADMTDPLLVQDVVSRHRPDVIVNAAPLSGQGAGIEALVESALSARLNYFIHLSDSDLYGPSPDLRRAAEDEPLVGAHASHRDALVRDEKRITDSSLSYTIFRVFEPLGPGMPLNRFPMQGLEGVLADEEVFLSDTMPRDFIHVADAARAIELALRKRPHQVVLNLGSGTPVAPRAVIDRLARHAGKTPRIVCLPPNRAWRIADMERIWSTLGFSPERDLDRLASDIVTARLSPVQPGDPDFRSVPVQTSLERPTMPEVPKAPRAVSRRELFDVFRGRFGKGPEAK